MFPVLAAQNEKMYLPWVCSNGYAAAPLVVPASLEFT